MTRRPLTTKTHVVLRTILSAGTAEVVDDSGGAGVEYMVMLQATGMRLRRGVGQHDRITKKSKGRYGDTKHRFNIYVLGWAVHKK